MKSEVVVRGSLLLTSRPARSRVIRMSGYEVYYFLMEVVAYFGAVVAFWLWQNQNVETATRASAQSYFWISLGVAITMPDFRAIIRLAKPK